MSSTNRGYERHKTDYYVTPKKDIKDFLVVFFRDIAESGVIDDVQGTAEMPQRLLWLDPCCGGDEKHGASYPEAIKELIGLDIETMDIREDSKAEIKANYLEIQLDIKADIIITNPPFFCAKEIITKALDDVNEGGYVIMLLRLNFFGSKDRKEFLQNNMPILTYVHNRRMSFTDDGKTDSIEYAHFVWQKGRSPEFTMLKII